MKLKATVPIGQRTIYLEDIPNTMQKVIKDDLRNLKMADFKNGKKKFSQGTFKCFQGLWIYCHKKYIAFSDMQVSIVCLKST